MTENKKVAVVILGWNGVEFLKQFLPKVVLFTSPELCTIIVADNCSTDDSVAYVHAHHPTVEIIQNSSNGGYAKGYNEALRQVQAEYFVLLNQDVEVTENWVETVLSEMENDPTIAAAQPKLRAFHQRNYFEYAGACGGYLDKYGYAFCRGRLFETSEEDIGQYDTVADIFWASGACLFIRSKVYWEAGALDVDFFAHQEEIDLCWRIHHLGYRIINVPQAVVYHVGGGSLTYGHPHKTFLNFRNNLMMMFKNLPIADLTWRMPLRFLLDMAAALNILVRERNRSACWAIIRAQIAFFAAIPSLLRKRAALPRKGTTGLSDYSVVWQYFIKGKKKFSALP